MTYVGQNNLINSRKETYRWQETNSTLSIWNAIHPLNNWGQQSCQGSPQEISLSLIITWIGSTIIYALCVGWQKHQTQNYSKLKSTQQYHWMEYFFLRLCTSIPSLIFIEPQRLALSIPTVSGPILPSVKALSSASSSNIKENKGIVSQIESTLQMKNACKLIILGKILAG